MPAKPQLIILVSDAYRFVQQASVRQTDRQDRQKDRETDSLRLAAS